MATNPAAMPVQNTGELTNFAAGDSLVSLSVFLTVGILGLELVGGARSTDAGGKASPPSKSASDSGSSDARSGRSSIG